MAITTLAGLNAAFPGQVFHLHKVSATAQGSGNWHSLWLPAGFPGAGSAPVSLDGVNPGITTAGALPFRDTGSGFFYVGRIAGAAGGSGASFLLYDRLRHSALMDATVTTSTGLTGFATPNRPDTLGVGVELWVEVYTAPGATPSVLEIEYTNSAGTARTYAIGNFATASIPASAVVGSMYPTQLAPNDVGVRSVQSYRFNPSMGGAGSLGFTLLRRVAFVPPGPVNAPFSLDALALGFPRVYAASCLAWMQMVSGSTTGIFQAELNLLHG